VQVTISKEAEEYVRAHGGSVYVRPHAHRCCTGSLTLLDTTTSSPEDAAAYRSFASGSVAVRYLAGAGEPPRQLTIELRGVLRRRPVAFWDGCAYKL